MPFVAFSVALGIFCSVFINAYLLSRWKILVRGKYFWMRSLLSSSIAVLIFTFIGYTYRLFHLPLSQSLNFIITAYVIKLILEVIISPVCLFCTKVLKKIEGVDIYDNGVPFNPAWCEFLNFKKTNSY